MIDEVEADGWYLHRQRGSHRQFKHPSKKGTVTIAGKPSKDLSDAMVQSIRRQAQGRYYGR
jgi:predicted RNA binding protein YcfA (HicA-like mRNA interferase family)